MNRCIGRLRPELPSDTKAVAARMLITKKPHPGDRRAFLVQLTRPLDITPTLSLSGRRAP